MVMPYLFTLTTVQCLLPLTIPPLASAHQQIHWKYWQQQHTKHFTALPITNLFQYYQNCPSRASCSLALSTLAPMLASRISSEPLILWPPNPIFLAILYSSVPKFTVLSILLNPKMTVYLHFLHLQVLNMFKVMPTNSATTKQVT